MTTLITVPVSQEAARIAGIDVDQLLRDIGEASANDSSTALFGLLLTAQRVLLQAGADVRLKPAETRMDAMFHGGGELVLRPRLTDADYAAIVKRYEDAGDVQNADLIRRQWEVARPRKQPEHRPQPKQDTTDGAQ